jgi:hypothetical protein
MRGSGRLASGIGAAGSVALVLWVGRQNPSFVLMALFVVWTAAPFVGMLLALRSAARWPRGVTTVLCGCAVLTSTISLGVYGWVALFQPAKPAAAFLIVPVAIVVLTVAAVGIAWRSARAPGTPS